jgi:hypothetical protein
VKKFEIKILKSFGKCEKVLEILSSFKVFFKASLNSILAMCIVFPYPEEK